ncbi:MAG: sigma-54-dependent Fis family transcriptional regulator [Bacteroidetes bacterium]|nr:MAG: sigma-54-dependent Fis family transcriptional regulator [Bacteroidota bacterium]
MTNLQAIKQRFGIISASELLDRALSTAVRVAPTDLTVLISGESGVGKEAFSKIIHALSPRKHNAFIAINCGAIPSGTINSELFGHEKGAFTGATSERKGYFETADGGTIFLDEISEMPLDTQAYLLRVLETGEFIRVGSSKVQKTNVRVIAATNVDLEERVRNGKFREDLYYRLNTVPIRVPSLKERPEDIYLLFRKFTLDFAERHRIEPVQLDESARRLLEQYPWPGNVRELKNVAEQVSILAEERMLTAEQLLEFLPQLRQRHLPAIAPLNGGNPSDKLEEREILYKFLFDMKNDLNDLKGLVFELIRNNNLSLPDKSRFQHWQNDAPQNNDLPPSLDHRPLSEPAASPSEPIRPVIVEDPVRYQKAEVVEENLNLMEMEKELIKKALKKHRGRRKDAAQELGISERTLYRKIKEYDLQ